MITRHAKWVLGLGLATALTGCLIDKSRPKPHQKYDPSEYFLPSLSAGFEALSITLDHSSDTGTWLLLENGITQRILWNVEEQEAANQYYIELEPNNIYYQGQGSRKVLRVVRNVSGNYTEELCAYGKSAPVLFQHEGSSSRINYDGERFTQILVPQRDDVPSDGKRPPPVSIYGENAIVAYRNANSSKHLVKIANSASHFIGNMQLSPLNGGYFDIELVGLVGHLDAVNTRATISNMPVRCYEEYDNYSLELDQNAYASFILNETNRALFGSDAAAWEQVPRTQGRIHRISARTYYAETDNTKGAGTYEYAKTEGLYPHSRIPNNLEYSIIGYAPTIENGIAAHLPAECNNNISSCSANVDKTFNGISATVDVDMNIALDPDDRQSMALGGKINIQLAR